MAIASARDTMTESIPRCVCRLAAIVAFFLAASLHAAEATHLETRTDWGERVLTFDFPALEVGIAEYADGPTGVTVLNFPAGAAAALDVRGGSPGVVGDYGFVHAISLAGGSLLGLEAASGVAAGLLGKLNEPVRWDSVPVVSGGVVYDFGPRNNSIYADKRLGLRAVARARTGGFPLGARGAGMSVTVGNGFGFDRGEAAGQGAAFRQIGEVKIFACVVLNALGAIYDREGNVVLGHVDPTTGERTSFAADLERRIAEAPLPDQPGQNTTLTVVVTNQTLVHYDLVQLARQVHSSMARAIQPFHTRNDGDALWAVSTREVSVPTWSLMGLGVAASEVVWDAVLEAHP